MKSRTLLLTLGLVVLMAAAAPVAAFLHPPLVGANQALVVLTGSMEPAFAPGSVVWIEDVDYDDLRVGDVVTYRFHHDNPRTYTHRIVDIVEDERGRLLITKGDANEDVDPQPVTEELVVGRQTFVAVPHLGFLMMQLQSRFVYLILSVGGILVAGLELTSLLTRGEDDDVDDLPAWTLGRFVHLTR